MRNISNSEVTTWLSCRMQYYFAHYLNLEPKVMGSALYRGNVGHEYFQRYSEARIDGKTHERSMEIAGEIYVREMKRGLDPAIVLQTKQITDKYMAYHQGWPTLRILSVEQKYDLPLNDHMTITIRYDTMVEEIASGKIMIGDYKFTYDFWTPNEHALNGQMPKYIAVMQANGKQVHGGFLEELRTRKLSERNGNANDPKQLWRRTKYFPSNAKKINTIRQHVAAGFEIIDYRDASDEDRDVKTLPVLNRYNVCKNCNFQEPCASRLDGGDITFLLERNYQQNTYGYNPENEAAREGLL